MEDITLIEHIKATILKLMDDKEMLYVRPFSNHHPSTDQIKFHESNLHQSFLQGLNIGSPNESMTHFIVESAISSKSSFVPWKEKTIGQHVICNASQRFLKMVLFRLPLNSSNSSSMSLLKMDNLQQLDISIDVIKLEHEVLITISCPWRDYLLIDILEEMNNLNLDTHTVQSSMLDGTFTLSLKSKVCVNHFI